ncbi:MAG: hypothetical protein HN790_10770 [Methylococcales bacterium]|nr:hypothetical protein [Methylococcales bacterium]
MQLSLVICHDNNTIEIDISELSSHSDDANTSRISVNGYLGKLHGSDYYGSCDHNGDNNETLQVVANCKGGFREKLVLITQEFFEPIVISDSSIDDDLERLAALSDCVTSSSGQGHDSGSDSGDNIVVMSCYNGTSTDKRYREKLKSLQKNHHDFTHRASNDHQNIPIIISDSSLDDSGVSGAVTDCFEDGGRIVQDHRSDSGHNFKVMLGCQGDSGAVGNSSRKSLISAITQHHKNSSDGCFSSDSSLCEEDSLPPVVVTTDSLQDVDISNAIADCTDPNKGGGTVSTVSLDPTSRLKGFSGRLNFRENKNLK